MIKSLTVTNHLDESVHIVLGDLDRSGFLITRIEGLGPCKATINSTEMATGDGSIFNSSRLEPRNIVITMMYDYRFGESVEDLRHKSYRYFPIKKKVKLAIETGKRICGIEGYVESNSPLIFSPLQGTQISIMCPDPYFYDAGEDEITVTEFGSVADGFEFVYDPELGYGTISNESLSEPLLEFGKIIVVDHSNVVYNGDSEVGMIITVTMLNRVGDISISDVEDNTLMTLWGDKITKITGAPLDAGDVIYISTVRNDKSIKLLRGGVYYNILNALDRESSWFVLYPGNNLFAYSTSYGRVTFRIENKTLYEGV